MRCETACPSAFVAFVAVQIPMEEAPVLFSWQMGGTGRAAQEAGFVQKLIHVDGAIRVFVNQVLDSRRNCSIRPMTNEQGQPARRLAEANKMRFWPRTQMSHPV